MISVCIATYNGEKYIRRQLDSILVQLSDEDEIVISDDHSQDGTLSVIDGMASPRIRVFMNEGEKGYTPNFENALSHAKGDYIFLADQDDVWQDNKVSVCLHWMQTHDLVVSDAVITDSGLHVTGPSFYAERKPYRSWAGNILKFGYLGCCMAFRRNVLEKALPFPKDHRLCTHDNWLFLVGKTFFKTAVIDDRLVCYRRHDSATSTGGFRDTTTLGFKIRYRLYLLLSLLRVAANR